MAQSKTNDDIPISLALLAFAGFGSAYAYLVYFRHHPQIIPNLFTALEFSASSWAVIFGSFLFNCAVVSIFFKRKFGLVGQGKRLAAVQGQRQIFRPLKRHAISLGVGLLTFYRCRDWSTEVSSLLLRGLNLSAEVELVGLVISINLGVFSMVLFLVALAVLGKTRAQSRTNGKLYHPDVDYGDLVLGTSPGGLTAISSANEEWVKIPARGMNGGILISGSPGSGKTQGAILQYLEQIVNTPGTCPAILAIDPKRTFLKEAESIIREAGLEHLIVKISLKGNSSFNPVFVNEPLKDSRFVELAEMVRSAAVNFMGKSSDSPFWEVSSSHLIRNTIAFCAAKYGYFTLLDVYSTIVRASKENIADELKECLAEKSFTEEERFNIGRAVEYFENEYSQLEDRVRTGIVATSTAFINQFQEYAASKVFCPKKSDLTIPSMEQLIRDGKILLFDISQPGLARSMGTFVKLHYQQAVLNLLPELKAKKVPCTIALIIDEYQDVVTCGGGGTIGDESFMAKARESKPAVIVATQSLSSLMNSIGSQRPALELVQNFRTRIACHSSDMETIKLFQDLAGKDDVESKTHSLSETAQSAKPNLFTGKFESDNASINEAVSRGTRREDVITGKEFSRLRTFEAFAQVFDGVDTIFIKLFLKPYFLNSINTKHELVLEMLRVSEKGGAVDLVKRAGRYLRGAAAALLFAGSAQAGPIPSACTVASSPAFTSCLELTTSGCTCGYPPRPCALISYYVPQTFLEVWPEPRSSYFTAIPGAGAQLAAIPPRPYGAEGDDDTQSYHAHGIAVPWASLIFETMPAGGTRNEKMCFDGMSEHFGKHWDTGSGDLLQPSFLAWGAAPKACLLKGAVTSAMGGSTDFSSDSGSCSFPQPLTQGFLPSKHAVCNGWGVFFPRYGTYAGPASMTGALMIASRLKSLSGDVLKTMPSSPDEKWQMIYPQSSSCFREGQNVGLLENLKNARETMRLVNGKLKGYLFVVWKRTTTCEDWSSAAQAQAAAVAIPSACAGAQ